MHKILIGIITHNHDRFIEKCILSVFNQSYPCDIVVTDDGSSDGTPDIIKELGRRFSGNMEFVFHDDNSGDACRGYNDVITWTLMDEYDYTFFLSGDDMLTEDSISLLVKRALETNADWTYGTVNVIDENDEHLATWSYEDYPESIPSAIAYMWARKSLGTPITALFKNSFLDGKKFVKFDGTNFASDTATAIEWYSKWPTIARERECVLLYRRQIDSETFRIGWFDKKSERTTMIYELNDKMIKTFGLRNIQECYFKVRKK